MTMVKPVGSACTKRCQSPCCHMSVAPNTNKPMNDSQRRKSPWGSCSSDKLGRPRTGKRLISRAPHMRWCHRLSLGTVTFMRGSTPKITDGPASARAIDRRFMLVKFSKKRTNCAAPICAYRTRARHSFTHMGCETVTICNNECHKTTADCVNQDNFGHL